MSPWLVLMVAVGGLRCLAAFVASYVGRPTSLAACPLFVYVQPAPGVAEGDGVGVADGVGVLDGLAEESAAVTLSSPPRVAWRKTIPPTMRSTAMTTASTWLRRRRLAARSARRACWRS